jgi:hypothetical protein
LHQGNLERIGHFPKIENSHKEILSWNYKILRLLDIHKIMVYNSTDEIWVGMEETTTGKPFWNFMRQLSPEQVDDLKKKGITPCFSLQFFRVVRHTYNDKGLLAERAVLLCMPGSPRPRAPTYDGAGAPESRASVPLPSSGGLPLHRDHHPPPSVGNL